MGFKVTMKQRWKWVINKVENKLHRWQKRQLSIAGKAMVINHFITPSIIYFLSCWRPPDSNLKEFIKLYTNYLWGGDPWNQSITKVKWYWCSIPKEFGGLGIRDAKQCADRMSAKWIIRAALNPSEDWAILLMHNIESFNLAGHLKWNNLPSLTVMASKYTILPKGSKLSCTIWMAWNRMN